MDNFVRFKDSVNLVPLKIPDDVKDYYVQAFNQNSQNIQPLRVRIAATHSGKVTRNNGFYLPHKMRAGASSFVSQYPKPIQIHHADMDDPIGRVVDAKYVDISRGIRDSLKDSVTVKNDQLIQDFITGNLSLEDTISFANAWIINDLKLTASDDPDYEGLGYIELVANITDPNAIQKVLDGRYLTGSVGATTNQAICSICKQDWAADDGRCEHRPGKRYEDGKCVIIAGDLTYDEYSFVNKPADRHSRVIEVNVNGIQDFVNLDSDDNATSKNIPEIQLVIDDKGHSKEDFDMTFKKALALAKKQDRFKDQKDLVDHVKQIIDKHKQLKEEKLFELLDAVYIEDTGKSNTDNEDNQAQTDPVKDFFGDEYDAIIGDNVDEGRQYAESLYALIADAESDEEKAEMTKLVNDAKLSSKKRKSLPDSAFCGPNRSFPVNDCAHYTAALRLLSRYKGEGSKDRIRACIERKGKRLGCNKNEDKKKDAAQDQKDISFSVEYFDSYSDEEIINMFDALQSVLKEREIDSGCSKEPVVDKTSQKELQELQDRLDVSRKEIRYLHSDIDSLTDSVANHIELLRSSQVSHILDMKRLSDMNLDIDKYTANLKDKSNEELVKILQDTSQEVDIQKIADSLNSGLSNDPAGVKVENPVMAQDNTKEPEHIVARSTEKQALFDKIKYKWLEMRMYNKDQANTWLDKVCEEQQISKKDLGINID